MLPPQFQKLIQSPSGDNPRFPDQTTALETSEVWKQAFSSPVNQNQIKSPTGNNGTKGKALNLTRKGGEQLKNSLPLAGLANLLVDNNPRRTVQEVNPLIDPLPFGTYWPEQFVLKLAQQGVLILVCFFCFF